MMNVAPKTHGFATGTPTLDAFVDGVTLSTPYSALAPSLASLANEDGLNEALRHFPHNALTRAPLFYGATFVDSSWTLPEAALFLRHSQRSRFHVSVDRQFSRSYWTRVCAKCRTHATPTAPASKQPGCMDDTCGVQKPRTAPYNRLGDYEYIRLTDPHFAAFATADIDTPGTPGGSINNLHPDVLAILTKMRQLHAAPDWIGINPTNGKAQLIWAIDPVYSDGDPTKPNRPMKLLKRVQHGLNELLNGDKAFAHGFMRNPLYSGPNPNAYRWNCYPFRIHKLKDLEAMLEQLGALTTAPDKTPTPAKTGTDLILQAKANRERAQRMRALSDELDGLSVEELERHDPSYIQGVRVLYDAAGTPQRDETAFRHALKTAHRAHKRGQRLKDNLIIDAYEHAYRIAHAQDTLGRPDEMPPMRDRLTMARRVRAYATTNKTAKEAGTGLSSTQHVTPTERRALRTFGSRGGKATVQRRANNPEEREPLRKGWETANKRRKVRGQTTRAQIQMIVGRYYEELERVPTWAELMEEAGVSRATVARHMSALKAAGMLPD